jgi:hypothetical protein
LFEFVVGSQLRNGCSQHTPSKKTFSGCTNPRLKKIKIKILFFELEQFAILLKKLMAMSNIAYA